MNETELRDRLRETDAAFVSHQSAVPDAEACRRVLARRARTRRTVAVSIAILGCFAGATAIFRGDRDAPPMATNSRPQTSKDQPIADLLREAETYAQEAAKHERMVALLREAERLVELEQELAELEASVGPLPAEVRVQEEINRVATTQLVIAARLLNDYDDAELAAGVYRQVVAEFPETQWAAAAQDALSRLATSM